LVGQDKLQDALGTAADAKQDLATKIASEAASLVAAMKKNVAWANAHGSNFDGDAEIDDFVARRGILAVRAKTERREAHIQDCFGITDVTIQNRAATAQLSRAGAHQFSPQRVSRRRTGIDVDFVGAEVIEGFEH